MWGEMEITAVRLYNVEGPMVWPGDLFEERLIRPLDIYPEHRLEGAAWLPTDEKGRYRIEAYYVKIETDEGVEGWAGPFTEDQSLIIGRQLAPLLVGHDPLAIERLWDRMYRCMVHGRKGVVMQAISAVDCALWDLKGKWAGVPVYRLLGGPVRDSIPAYASALGLSLEPELVRARATELAAQGYCGTKWFVRHGPADGPEGIARNVELVRILRESVGPDVDIMLDAWMSWDVPYTVQMARRLEDYRLRWIEEPVLPDKIEQLAEIRRRVSIPIATGEHEYTRWGQHALMAAGAVDVVQADPYWAGGISELVKICTLASVYDLQVVPHGYSMQAALHVIAAQPVTTCPMIEYLLRWGEYHQFFNKNPIRPVQGVVTLPDTPGIDMEFDEAKIERFEEVRYS